MRQFRHSWIYQAYTHELQTLLPRSDHHQVVQKARAHFLFLHFYWTKSCPSRHSVSTLPLELVVGSHGLVGASSVRLKPPCDDHCDGLEALHLEETMEKMEHCR